MQANLFISRTAIFIAIVSSSYGSTLCVPAKVDYTTCNKTQNSVSPLNNSKDSHTEPILFGSELKCEPEKPAVTAVSPLNTDLKTLCYPTTSQTSLAPIALDYSGPSAYSKPGCDPVAPVSASSATPEPGTLALLSLPLIGLSLLRRKSKAENA